MNHPSLLLAIAVGLAAGSVPRFGIGYCGNVPPPETGCYVGLAPEGTPWRAAIWRRLEADGSFALEVDRPGRYRLAVAANIDPLASELNEAAMLVVVQHLQLERGTGILQLDLPLGGISVKIDRVMEDSLTSHNLVRRRGEDLYGWLGLDRIHRQLGYRIPRVSAGPAEVVRVRAFESVEFLARIEVPEGGIAEIELR